LVIFPLVAKEIEVKAVFVAYKLVKFLQLIKFKLPDKLGKLRKSKVSNKVLFPMPTVVKAVFLYPGVGLPKTNVFNLVAREKLLSRI